MEHTTLRQYVKEWEGILYTGNVLAPPGYVSCGKFAEQCVKLCPSSENDTRKMVREEIVMKLEPFKEMHPNSTFKHLCRLFGCQVS